jgi:hypothetical protein
VPGGCALAFAGRRDPPSIPSASGGLRLSDRAAFDSELQQPQPVQDLVGSVRIVVLTEEQQDQRITLRLYPAVASTLNTELQQSSRPRGIENRALVGSAPDQTSGNKSQAHGISSVDGPFHREGDHRDSPSPRKG